MPNEITDAAARSAKASKTLDTMRARIVKAGRRAHRGRDRGREPRSGRGVGCTRHPCPASKPPCVATARSWPTAPAGDSV